MTGFEIGLIGLAFGLFLGGTLGQSKWRSNADRIQMLEDGGQFYKVVRLEDPQSIEYLKVHVLEDKPSKETQDVQ